MNSNERESTTPGVPWCQVLGILATAMLLGLIYNNSSPLGVRATRATAPETAENAPKRMGFVNESISLTLEEARGTIAPALAAPPAKVLDFPHLTWVQVKPLVAAGKVVLVDARAKTNYDLDHIPGAVSLPATSSAAEVLTFAKAYPKSTAFVSYCGSESCNASRQTSEALARIGGFVNVSDMPGGYAEFLAAKP